MRFWELPFPFRAGYTLKSGGVHKEWGLNLGFNTAEDINEVNANRRAYETALGSGLGFVYGNQIHSERVLIVDKPGIYSEVDGFVTREKNLVLNILTADCLGILAYDPVHEVIGAFHAGWKGTRDQILGKGLRLMEELGAKARDIQVMFNPCIKVQSYEVGEEFRDFFPRGEFFQTRNKRSHFDLVRANAFQLLPSQLEKLLEDKENTYESDFLYSYRRDAVKAGRFSNYIYMQKKD